MCFFFWKPGETLLFVGTVSSIRKVNQHLGTCRLQLLSQRLSLVHCGLQPLMNAFVKLDNYPLDGFNFKISKLILIRALNHQCVSSTQQFGAAEGIISLDHDNSPVTHGGIKLFKTSKHYLLMIIRSNGSVVASGKET